MEDQSQAWRDYKSAVLERFTDYGWLFGNLKKQRPSGDGWVAACCPFHNDHNPSFAFNTKTGRWACFSKCGKGGPLDYLMHSTGASFKEALFSLGDKVGVARPNGYTAAKSPARITEQQVQKLQDALQQAPEILAYLRDRRGLTDATIARYQLGWDGTQKRVSIPIRDETGLLVNIRLYSPKQKAKMINTKGCGSPPRLYGADELAKYEGKQVILCEGEFDRLILAQNGFMAVTSTHGCTSFRAEWLDLFEGKEVVIGYDADEEGQAAVEAIVLKAFKSSKAASVRNLKLPLAGTKEDKDFTDYFTKARPINGDLFNKHCLGAHDLQKLIAETPVIDLVRFAPGTKDEDGGAKLLTVLNMLRNSDHLKSHERHVAIAEAAAEHLGSRGAFFYDTRSTDEFLCLDAHVYPIGNNRSFNTLLQRIGRFSWTNPEGKFVWEFLRNHARDHGAPVESSTWVYGAPDLPALYLHAHDTQGRILKIAAGAITSIPNGQNPERILLNPSDRVLPFEWLPDQDMAEGLAIYRDLLFSGAPCSEADKAFLLAFLPVVFLRDFCPTKPLIRMSGVHGSGKTSLAATLSYLVYGESVGKSSTSSANYTDASKNPLTILDNKEGKDIDRDLLNFLLTSSTGIVHEKRKLYENQEIIRERANAFVITNGIETLGKPELLSRQWEIACERSFFRGDFSETEHWQLLRRHRDKVLSALFKLIAHEILPRLGDRKSVENLLTAEYADHPKRRTFGCLSLILLAWDALTRLLKLPEGLEEEWLKAQHQLSEEASQETNVFVQFLALVQASNQTFKGLGLQECEADDWRGFEAGSITLHNLFAKLARENGLPIPFANAKQLGERLRESIGTLREAGWRVEMRARKCHDGLWRHRFLKGGSVENNE